GKDNIVFHCIVFPAMLKAHGEYALPVNVPANQFLNFEGQKFSKSRGWGIEQHEYLEEFADFPNKEDALRYALIRNLPENKDSDFKWDDFVEYHDKELADNLGNFLNRVVVLTDKYYKGVVPEVQPDPEVLDTAYELCRKWAGEIEAYNFKNAVQVFTELSSYGNTYLQDVSPWKLYKANPEDTAVAQCLYHCLQIGALLSVVAAPFIPFTATKIRHILRLPELQDGDLQRLLDQIEKGEALIPAGHQIGEPELLFAKIHDRKDSSRLDLINKQKGKLEEILHQEEQPQDFEAIKPLIEFDDFTKLDLRIGTILEAEKVPKAKKLLQLKIDLGLEQRTVVSGIAEYFKPEEVVGQQVVLVANLAPRKIRGVESQGMILMA
ncbi:MAG: methionine--tRNA ligase subunit beta, partial [Phaeodactylibacter sp.]|nr:methionine--tRNA ligase subunit beta [Phaeodactylibacter sp.]